MGWLTLAFLLFPAIGTVMLAAVWWQSLTYPWLFIFIGAAVLTVSYLAVGEYVFPPHEVNNFLPAQSSVSPIAQESAVWSFAKARLPALIVIVVCGIPFLWWLKHVFGKP
jgi:hypothetical protein